MQYGTNLLVYVQLPENLSSIQQVVVFINPNADLSISGSPKVLLLESHTSCR